MPYNVKPSLSEAEEESKFNNNKFRRMMKTKLPKHSDWLKMPEFRRSNLRAVGGRDRRKFLGVKQPNLGITQPVRLSVRQYVYRFSEHLFKGYIPLCTSNSELYYEDK